MGLVLEPLTVIGYHGTTRKTVDKERAREVGDHPVVVAARIGLHGFIDLLGQQGMSVIQDFAKNFQRRELASTLSNTRGAHKLDCAVLNFTTAMLSSLKVKVTGYRAACVEGKALTPGSPIFDLSHLQLVVVNQQAILEKWIVPTDEKIEG